MSSVADVLNSQAVETVTTTLAVLVAAWLGARIQGRHGKEVERDRLRHDIAARTAESRLSAHVDLAAKVSSAYREKIGRGAASQRLLDSAKNYYYDHRFFYSPDLGRAFQKVCTSLGVDNPSKEVLEANLNGFFDAVRDDLLLRELTKSVGRAIEAGARGYEQ